MTTEAPSIEAALDARARQSLGASDQAIYNTVCTVLRRRSAGGALADVGCGQGRLWDGLRGRFTRCYGVDAVRYAQLPDDVEFVRADLDRTLPLPDSSVDVAAAVETIEHLENPRAFIRELTRITRTGGLIVISTPNQLSLLSLLTLALRGQFSAFRDNAYPAHRTALLETDLRRMAAECGLGDLEIDYTARGRMPLTGRHYPTAISRTFPRRLSDNLLLSARKLAVSSRTPR